MYEALQDIGLNDEHKVFFLLHTFKRPNELDLLLDGFGKDWLNSDLELYNYKNVVPLPILGIINDIYFIEENIISLLVRAAGL